MYATTRPTITYRATADSGEPYIIVADRVRMKGTDRMWAGGKVTIDRSDVAARGDSLSRDETKGLAVLIGKPEVRGQGIRSYRLVGRRIEMVLALREVRLIKALGAGEATGADWKLDCRHDSSRHGATQTSAGVCVGRLVSSAGFLQPEYHRGRLARARCTRRGTHCRAGVPRCPLQLQTGHERHGRSKLDRGGHHHGTLGREERRVECATTRPRPSDRPRRSPCLLASSQPARFNRPRHRSITRAAP